MRGGDAQAVDLGEAIWVCDLETTPLTRAQMSQYRTMHARNRGAMGTLAVYDAFCARPAAYPASSATNDEWYASEETWFASEETWLSSGVELPWGAPAVVTHDQTNSMIYVTGYLPGATISSGDMGHWDDGVTRRLALILDAATADASGNVWLRIEPPPPPLSTNLPAAFVMNQPSAEMRIAKFDAPVQVGDLWRVQITAAQILRRSTV